MAGKTTGAASTATKTAAKAVKLQGAENITISVSADTVLVAIKRNVKGRMSGSGKNRVYASSKGNKQIPGTDLTLGLNIYGPLDDAGSDDDEE